MQSKSITVEPKEKTCSRCKESWPADQEFFKFSPTSKDQLSDKCLDCIKCGCWGLRSRARQGKLTKGLCEFQSLFTKNMSTAQAPAFD